MGRTVFASRHDLATAERFLAKLGRDPVAETELAQAQFAERWLNAAEALKHYQAAIAATPPSSAAWSGITSFNLRQGKLADASAAAARGLALLPRDPELLAWQGRLAILRYWGRWTTFSR